MLEHDVASEVRLQLEIRRLRSQEKALDECLSFCQILLHCVENLSIGGAINFCVDEMYHVVALEVLKTVYQNMSFDTSSCGKYTTVYTDDGKTVHLLCV